MRKPCLDFYFERPAVACTYVWHIRFWPMLKGYKVTCNGAGWIYSDHASRTKAKHLLKRFLNWACFEDAKNESRVVSGNG